jgi:hypothetical protein
VYDRQQITCTPEQAKSSKWKQSMKGIAAVLTIVGIEFAFFGTSGGNWRSSYPLLAQIRDATPDLLLALLAVSASKLVIAHAMSNVKLASRTWVPGKKLAGVPLFHLVVANDTTVKAGKFSASVSKMVFLVMILGSSVILQSFTDQAPIYIAAASGVVSLLFSAHYMSVCGKRMSFRSLVLWPVIVLAIWMALSALIVGVVYLVQMFKTSPKVVDVSAPSEAKSSMGIDKMYEDLAVLQVISIMYSWLWAMVLGSPFALISLAYRYDASQLGYASVDDAEADSIIGECQNSQVKDNVGRVPIPLSTVALPRSTLSSAEMPTFRAAIQTLFLFQVFGVMVDATTGWQKRAVYPTSASTKLDNVLSVSIWPFLAYFFICLAMTASVYRRSDRTFKSLWTYGEQWMVEVESEETVAVQANESQVEEAKEVEKLI